MDANDRSYLVVDLEGTCCDDGSIHHSVFNGRSLVYIQQGVQLVSPDLSWTPQRWQ